MFIYNDSFSYEDPLNVVFLCGTKYAKADPREKRNVLKIFLESNLENCRAVILEENFIFGRTNMEYLSYDDIFLTGLAQVEQMASLFANKIIIIHETISTAAELGMFAINPALSKKICLLVPDDISIEERKTSVFIKLAFINRRSEDTQVGKEIIYYPDIETNRVSTQKSDYYTFFHNNKIGENLGQSILSFIEPLQVQETVKFTKNSFRKEDSNPHTISYHIDSATNTINVSVHANILKIQLLALFLIEEYRVVFRQSKAIKEHVKFICVKYEEILKNTITDIEGKNAEHYCIKVNLKGTEVCSLRQAVGYYMYMLQAIGLIGLEQTSSREPSKRKIRISTNLDSCKKEIGGWIIEKDVTAFGRLKT